MGKIAREPKHIDIGNIPELLRIAEEVRSTRKPRLLRRNSEDIAVLMPVKPRSRRSARRGKSEADYEAFRSAAGGWIGVDTDKLIADIYAHRRSGDRPHVEL